MLVLELLYQIRQFLRLVERYNLELEGDDDSDDAADELPDLDSLPSVTRIGDLWTLGDPESAHRILCADSTDPASYEYLLGDNRAAMIFTDPPYNLPARTIGQVCAGKHGDFAMGSGEMSSEEFRAFLGEVNP